MNAHRLFKKDARVCIARENQSGIFQEYRDRVGTVTGFSRDAQAVYVRWDGYKAAYAIYAGYLTSEENAIREAVPASDL